MAGLEEDEIEEYLQLSDPFSSTSRLDKDVQKLIWQWFDPSERAKMGSVCKHWFELSRDQNFWKKLCLDIETEKSEDDILMWATQMDLKNSFDWFLIYTELMMLPHWGSPNSNCKVHPDGRTFENVGSGICWASAESKESFSYGTRLIKVFIAKSREYGGQCSNTTITVKNRTKRQDAATLPGVNFWNNDTIFIKMDFPGKSIHFQVWKDTKELRYENSVSDCLHYGDEFAIWAQVIYQGDHLVFVR